MSRKSALFLLGGAALGSALLAVPGSAAFQQPAPAAQPAPAPQPPVAAPAAVPAEPIEVRIQRWDRLRSPTYTPNFIEVSDFLLANPGWPGELELRQRAESAINDYTPVSTRAVFFNRHEPTTATARFRYAEALLATGQGDRAVEEAKKAWRSGGIVEAQQANFLARFGSTLTPADHAQRVDVLLWDGDVEQAQRMLAYLAPNDRLLAQARIQLQRASDVRGGNPDAARAAIASVPANLAHHPGFIVDQSRFYRTNGNSMLARQLLARTTIAPGSAADRNAWMEEFLAVARSAEADRQYDLAYKIVDGHGGLPFDRSLMLNTDEERDTFTSLEWLGGWVALHNLRRPMDALKHFQNFANAAQFAPTRARGLYWAGRAAEAANLTADANGLYEAAARFPLTFYGQLAHEELGRPIQIATATAQPTPAERASFAADARVQAAILYGQRGDVSRQKQFIDALVDDPEIGRALIAELASRYGHADLAIAAARGMDADGPPAILAYAYPRLEVPGSANQMWTMVHAITRQESRFDVDARSHAGALGLMQLMPGTARETARKIGRNYDLAALTRDRQYNMLLGSTYFRNLVDYWGGNHVLAIASYNAGPGNVRKWLQSNGDPRLATVDTLKWIEEIPFYETRNYVRSVLENAVVYDTLEPSRARTPAVGRLSAYLGNSLRG